MLFSFMFIPKATALCSHKSIVLLILRVTQEYRENLAKMAKASCEQSKQSIRKIRQKGMSDVKKNKKGRSEDDVKTVEKMVIIRYLFP